MAEGSARDRTGLEVGVAQRAAIVTGQAPPVEKVISGVMGSSLRR